MKNFAALAAGARQGVAALFLIAWCAASFAQTFTGSMSGSWWSPARSGEGQLVTFETVGNRQVAFLSYFTYTPEGTATWLVGNADYQPGATSIVIPVFTGSGARFGGAFRAADVRIAPAGSATLEFVSCKQMRLKYAGTESFDIDLVRLIGPLDGLGCPQASPPPRTASSTFVGTMAGAWWNPARSGEGQVITFETVGTRNVVFFTYFTYDASGAASWLVGNADYRAGAASLSIPLFRATGAHFGNAFRAADVRLVPAGNVVLDYASCSQMRMRYVGAETLAFDLTRLVGPLTGADCPPLPQQFDTQGDTQLRALLRDTDQTGNAARSRVLPSINDPLPQLGKLLFFSKALSGRLDTACASCHHPTLGGADGLSLPVGAGSVSHNVLGPGRRLAAGGFSVGRNANTYFNIGLRDRGLFWDSRVESVPGIEFGNGEGGAIRTPDTPLGAADPRAGPTLPAAQARFPVPNVKEMRGDAYPGLNEAQYRDRIAARLGSYGAGAGELAPSRWLDRFRAAFGSQGTAEQLITFDNIALALAEYERSAVFVDNPWSRFVRGNNDAISDFAKQGALFFFRTAAQGGSQCAQCHKGDAFTDERHHVTGFAQIGGGSGDGANGTDDFGRSRQTALDSDRYRFRTPSLLNVELTAPYGHAGAYPDFFNVANHYLQPVFQVNDYIARRGWCSLPQFIAIADCAAAAPDVSRNSLAALAQMAATRQAAPTDSLPVLTGFSLQQIVAFIESLTDPCLRDRACFAPWIPRPDEAPDGHQLDATNASGTPL